MRASLAKPRVSRPGHYRVLYTPQGYGCMEYPSGSLKPVPPGSTRRSLGYCDGCQADHCLFPGNGRRPEPEPKPEPVPVNHHTKGTKTGYHQRAADARARGVTMHGQPLTPSCYNCAHLRRNGHGYLCRYRPDDPPYGRATMMLNRRVADTGCTAFVLRRVVDIPPLD
jgi:hypothetical protein